LLYSFGFQVGCNCYTCFSIGRFSFPSEFFQNFLFIFDFL
jgi:hypothetical protein